MEKHGAPGGVSLLQLPLALVALLPLPGPEFKRGQWSFRVLGVGLIGHMSQNGSKNLGEEEDAPAFLNENWD